MPRLLIPKTGTGKDTPPESFWLGEKLLSDESVKDVLAQVCRQIADGLAEYGFRYLASQRKYLAAKGRFSYEIGIRSSKWNQAGRHVDVHVWAVVRSAELEQMRRSLHPEALPRDYAAGGLVHLLTDDYGFLSWEFADPTTRAETIGDLLVFIRSVVMPYFRRFEDSDALAAELKDTGLPGLLIPKDEVELAYCVGGRNVAQAALDRFLGSRQDLQPAIEAETASPSATCLTAPSGYAEQVVYLRHHYGLN